MPPAICSPREQWSVVYADSHETTGEAAQAGLVMDNQPTTYWHTKWQGTTPGTRT